MRWRSTAQKRMRYAAAGVKKKKSRNAPVALLVSAAAAAAADAEDLAFRALIFLFRARHLLP